MMNNTQNPKYKLRLWLGFNIVYCALSQTLDTGTEGFIGMIWEVANIPLPYRVCEE